MERPENRLEKALQAEEEHVESSGTDVIGLQLSRYANCIFRSFLRDGEPVLLRRPEIDFIDDKAGKPVGIHQFIGRRPILAVGNSDGDFEMLEWTTAGEGARLGLLVHNTDAEREWAYDRDSHVGRLARGLDEADERGWIVVDMKNDWQTVYP